MSTEPSSPRRRHILSSINHENHTVEDSQRRGKKPTENLNPQDVKSIPSQTPQDGEADQHRPKRSRLRLKDHKNRRHRSRSRDTAEERSHPRQSRSHRHRHRRHHARSATPPNPHQPEPLSPEAAFRESLFDAMADDEGAAYWEGVYGQPIHVYANEKVGPAGELEQMTEEEYASHVRQKMWEKTHAGLVEEKAKREEARKKKAQEARQSQKLQADMEQSLRKGEERRVRRRWANKWADYLKAWSRWDGDLSDMAWPTESGKREDIDEKSVKTFLIKGLDKQDEGDAAFAVKLKDERFRWHPDKMQQKLRGNIDKDVMKEVTAIFQIIDSLWAEARSTKPQH